MKKFLLIILTVITVFSLSACGEGEKKSTYNGAADVKGAVEFLKDSWKEIYNFDTGKTDRYFEIKNTRVLTLKENSVEDFENVKYIIEFELYTDYFGCSPYYFDAGVNDRVLIMKDGTMSLSERDPLSSYRSKSFKKDFSEFLEAIDDLGDKYNCVTTIE